MPEEIKTVEVAEEPKAAEPIKSEPVTREALKEKGWSKAEMDAAEKRGMIPKVEEPNGKKPEPPKVPVASPIPEKPLVPEQERRSTDTSLPDFTFKTPEQEKAFLNAFGAGTPQRAMYFRMKNERQSRQRAEAERDKLALELQLMKDNQVKSSVQSEQELDADGNVVDPDDKPLTMKQLKALQKEELDTLNKQREELNTRSGKVSEALQVQEEYAKSILPDFDETVKLATDLVNNIDVLLNESPWKKSKVQKLIKDLQITAATADKYGIDDYTASMIAYELGQLHPKYGQPKAEPDGAPKVDPKANGEPKLTPEQMKRIEENTQRRASSASLPGSSGGRRTVSVDDVTIKDILRMSPEERYKFKKDHPEKMQKLMRG